MEEYRDYLERLAAYPERTPITRELHAQLTAEWERNYAALWDRVDTDPRAWPQIKRLENLLAV